jgi:magnesium transporter
MATPETLLTLQNRVESLIAVGAKEELQALLARLHPTDIAELLDYLDESQRIVVFELLDAVTAAEVLDETRDDTTFELVEAVPDEHVADLLEILPMDDAAELLSELPPERSEELIALMEPDEAVEVQKLLAYEEDTAGRLMTEKVVRARRRWTVEETIQHLREMHPETETFVYLYTVDDDDQLTGVVPLRRLLTAPPETALGDLVDPDVISVSVDTDQEDVARLVARKRIGWLLLLFVTESLTGTVLRHFAGELEAVVALAFFVPLLIGTGGNAGSQTTSTIIRALALGEVRPRDALRAFQHELRTALLLGLGMAAIAFGRALTWGSSQSLALTVSLAIFIIVVWANGLGSLLPLLAARLGIDPTVVSGPVMSTLVDATGLFIYFSIARLILGL